jgi:hypothetical protein
VIVVDVSALLDRRGVPHAVIGAVALAVHGVPRATADVDVLVTDPRCLDATWWESFVAAGATVDVRRGDAEDPLAGVVRIAPAGDTVLDLIVGRPGWQEDVVRRATRVSLAGAMLPVVRASDLIVLKLYAGGPQDAWDVDQLLDAVPGLEAEVDAALDALPAECATLWRRILGGRPSA